MSIPGQTQLNESRQGEALFMPDPANKGRMTGTGAMRKMYVESYGCQMNFSDSEIVASILSGSGFQTTVNCHEADLVLINTCSIRENAEVRVRGRLNEFKGLKKKNPGLIVGVLGCMAERLKTQLLDQEKIVDLVVGPDAYRDLPKLLEQVEGGQKAVNVLLSREETYADISPVRLDSNGVTAFISIMRGCDNMCSFCVVPYTRGRERSRDTVSIVDEARNLFNNGYLEVTLLGQNVDSYKYDAEECRINFAMLLDKVASISPKLRIRFSTSHPKDMTDEVLHVIAAHPNICKYIHLPVQSGNSKVLERMLRGYTREWYIGRIEAINRILPGCAISTDVIAGFCGETEAEHNDTISLMDAVKYDFAYMFNYSERPGTYAMRNFKDDVPQDLKMKRLQQIIDLQREHSALRVKQGVGRIHEVLIEGISKRSDERLFGRNSGNTTIVFPKGNYKAGEYVNVNVTSCTTTTLIGEVIP